MSAERLYRAILTVSDEGLVTLSEDERKHLVRVRRLTSGERFLGLLEGRGWQLCQLKEQNRDWSVQIIEPSDEPSDPELRITLAQSLIKRDKFEWVLQKATELGVSRIVPLVTKHTIVAARSPNRKQIQRWDRILKESLKQCGRTVVPTLEPVSTVTDVLNSEVYDRVFYLDEREGVALATQLEPCSQPLSVCFFVGPEGGWTETERATFSKNRVNAVSLGRAILRAETASIAVIAVLQFAQGEIGGERRDV